MELACAVKKQRPKLRSDHRASPATFDLSNVHNGGACSHRSEERQEGGQCSITLLPEEMAERITSFFAAFTQRGPLQRRGTSIQERPILFIWGLALDLELGPLSCDLVQLLADHLPERLPFWQRRAGIEQLLQEVGDVQQGIFETFHPFMRLDHFAVEQSLKDRLDVHLASQPDGSKVVLKAYNHQTRWCRSSVGASGAWGSVERPVLHIWGSLERVVLNRWIFRTARSTHWGSLERAVLNIWICRTARSKHLDL